MAWDPKEYFSTMDETIVEKFQETAVQKETAQAGTRRKSGQKKRKFSTFSSWTVENIENSTFFHGKTPQAMKSLWSFSVNWGKRNWTEAGKGPHLYAQIVIALWRIMLLDYITRRQ